MRVTHNTVLSIETARRLAEYAQAIGQSKASIIDQALRELLDRAKVVAAKQ